MTDLLARLRVILTASVTWLVAVSALLSFFADDIAASLPAPWDGRLTAWVLAAIGAIGVAIAIIRMVTPVLPEQRGLLNPEGVSRVATVSIGDTPPSDRGASEVVTVLMFLVAIVVLLVILRAFGLI